MGTQTDKESAFRKVGPCLYCYKNGVYYARFKSDGKEIRCSLETTDRKLAERNLAKKKDEQSRIDRSQGKLTLRELCDRWLQTIQDSKPKTLEQKSYVAARIKEHWPPGSLVQVARLKPSDCDVKTVGVGAVSQAWTIQSDAISDSCTLYGARRSVIESGRMKRTLLAVSTAVLMSMMALMFLGGLLKKAARVVDGLGDPPAPRPPRCNADDNGVPLHALRRTAQCG